MTYHTTSASGASVASRLAAIEAQEFAFRVKQLEWQVQGDGPVGPAELGLINRLGKAEAEIATLKDQIAALQAWSHPPGT